MYPSGGTNAFGAPPYGQPTGVSGSSITAPDSASHLSMPAHRFSGALGAPAAALHFGGQYGATFAPPQIGAQQFTGVSVPGMASTLNHGHGANSFAVPPSGGLYGQNQGAFNGRDLPSESARRYSDYVDISHSHQSELGNQLSFFREQQLLQAQQQPPVMDMRAADYLAARGTAIRHGSQDLLSSSYGIRVDTDPAMQGSRPLHGFVPGGATGSSAAGYGVTLPPGRDYSSGKVLGGLPLDPGYGGGLMSRTELSAIGNLSTEDHKKDRVREREREEELRRDRDRDRERERRERERDSEHGRARELRGRDRTPPKRSRDHKASTGKRSNRRSKRKSPLRREASHRRYSPAKERRPYACKITPCSLVEVERDLTSICRRYPRLSISPEFSKLVVRWPMKELEISLSTPVSFENDSVEISGEADASSKSTDKAVESGVFEPAKIVWNAKVILMSGLSSDALSELVSEKSSGNKVHINNILKFAILRKDRSFMAIGGIWNAEIDGGDPSIDEFSLVQTAIRCTRELVQIDLARCQRWNPFLEIHYDRVGEDGFHSYKEVTVVFLPDLASCLPSPDVWQSQWFSRRKARSERVLEMTAKKKDESGEKEDDAKGHLAAADVAKGTNRIKTEKDDKIKKEEEADAAIPKLPDKSKNANIPTYEVKKENLDSIKKEKDIDSVNPKTVDPQSAEKATKRKRDSKNSISEDSNKSAAKAKKGKGVAKVKKNEDGTEQVHTAVPETTTKNKKKKVVKKGSKKKTADIEKEVNADDKKDLKKGVTEEPKNTTKKIVKNKIIPNKSEEVSAEKETKNTDDQKINKKVIKKGEGKEDKPKETKQTEKVENDAGKGGKELKSEDASVEKNNRDAKTRSQKNKPEAPPPYPGLFLVTKQTKNFKLRGTTLSLDGLLDYNESDIEESTFELSLFAEALYEMLQYKMGCLILGFLEKLGENYLNKKNQRKRLQEENLDKKDNEKPETSSSKRLRLSETLKSEGDSGKPITSSGSGSKPQVEAVGAEQDEQKVEEETEESEEEDDPEEEPLDEDEEENASDSDKSQEGEASEDEHVDKGKESPDSSPKSLGQEVKTDDKKAKEEAPKQPIVNKVLLQAFRYFDCNSVGYIKVEDLRTIINNLGKFHSRRAVKELTRVAVLASNKNRDDRIDYPELLKVEL